LERAILSDAHLEGANLSGAHLEGADLSKTHLEGANGLTVEQIRSAVYWEKGLYQSEFYSQLQNAEHDRKQASESEAGTS
jgi:uncharacterized protein YjbI with pentapeptide repeats